MTEFRHSCVLFLEPDGDPMQFYMRPCPSRSKLKDIVEYGGGTFVSCASTNVIRLVEPGSTVLNIHDNEIAVSVQYIYDCVDQNVALDITPYVFEANSVALSDINTQTTAIVNTIPTLSEEDHIIINFVLNNNDSLFKMSNTSLSDRLMKSGIKLRTRQTLFDYLYRLLELIERFDLLLEEVELFKHIMGQTHKIFTRTEDISILRYIDENYLYSRLGEDGCFQEMEDKKVTPYPWTAMKNHFHSFIMNNIQKYCLPAGCLEKLLRHVKSNIANNVCLTSDSNSPMKERKFQKKRPLPVVKLPTEPKKTKLSKTKNATSSILHTKNAMGCNRQVSHSGSTKVTETRLPQNITKQSSASSMNLDKVNTKTVNSSARMADMAKIKVHNVNGALRNHTNKAKSKQFRFYNPQQYSLSLESTISETAHANRSTVKNILNDANAQTAMCAEVSAANLPLISDNSDFSVHNIELSEVTDVDVCQTSSLTSTPAVIDQFDSALLENMNRNSELPTDIFEKNIEFTDGLKELHQIEEAVQNYENMHNQDPIEAENDSLSECSSSSTLPQIDNRNTNNDSTLVDHRLYAASKADEMKIRDLILHQQESEDEADLEGTLGLLDELPDMSKFAQQASSHSESENNTQFNDDVINGEEEAVLTQMTDILEELPDVSKTFLRTSVEKEYHDNNDVEAEGQTERDRRTAFLTEATIVMKQLEEVVRSLNKENAMMETVKATMANLKLQLYRMLLTEQIEEILEKPELSTSDMTLMLKYLCHMTKKKPDLLIHKILNPF